MSFSGIFINFRNILYQICNSLRVLHIIEVEIRTPNHYNALFTMNKITREAINEANRNRLASLRESLERRMSVARAKGDDQLLRQLEAEASYLR
ncbi:MAG: hypothetical protein HLUCCO16_15545 [Phormidium sp. OSCR]|nr:MAG: hypothetical protein HLUCCO16_15545 [Phormidium sp. OSCR]